MNNQSYSFLHLFSRFLRIRRNGMAAIFVKTYLTCFLPAWKVRHGACVMSSRFFRASCKLDFTTLPEGVTRCG